MIVSRIIPILMLLTAVFSGCAEEKMSLNPQAGKALIGFSNRMTDELNKSEKALRTAKNAKETAAVLAGIPAVFGKFRSEAEALQKQYKNQDFSHFRTAAAKRNLKAASGALVKAMTGLSAVVKDEEIKKTKTAVDALVQGIGKGDRDKLLSDALSACDRYKTSSDKKVADAAAALVNAASYLNETAMLLDIQNSTGKLQIAMKQLDTTYKAREKEFKDNPVFKAASKKMKDEIGKLK